MQLIANLTMTAHEFLFMKLFGIVVLYLLDQTGKNCCPQGQNGGLISSLPECITPLDYFLSHIPKPDLVLLSATKFVQIPLRHYVKCSRDWSRAPRFPVQRTCLLSPCLLSRCLPPLLKLPKAALARPQARQ